MKQRPGSEGSHINSVSLCLSGNVRALEDHANFLAQGDGTVPQNEGRHLACTPRFAEKRAGVPCPSTALHRTPLLCLIRCVSYVVVP